MNALTYTTAGDPMIETAVLDASVFGILPKNHDLLKLAYNAYLANSRANLAVTKTRGEVSGGGKKPWKQKGTGRARFGSSRVPQWRHGGIVFGPTGNENYSLTVPVKAKRTALRQALSMAANEGRIRILETFECKDGKTSQTAQLFKKMEITGRVLLVVSQKDELVERATRNLPGVKPTHAQYLTVYDIVNADTIIINQQSLTIISDWLGKAPVVDSGEGDQS